MEGVEGKDVRGESEVGKPVFVTEITCWRTWMSVESDQMGLSRLKEETASSRRCRSFDFSGQWGIVCLNVSGTAAQRGQVVSGCSMN